MKRLRSILTLSRLAACSLTGCSDNGRYQIAICAGNASRTILRCDTSTGRVEKFDAGRWQELETQ